MSQYIISKAGFAHIINGYIGCKPTVLCKIQTDFMSWYAHKEVPKGIPICKACLDIDAGTFNKTVYIKHLICEETDKESCLATTKGLAAALDRAGLKTFADVFRVCNPEPTEINRLLDTFYDYCEGNRIEVK